LELAGDWEENSKVTEERSVRMSCPEEIKFPSVVISRTRIEGRKLTD
jgi:hypothetical protein